MGTFGKEDVGGNDRSGAAPFCYACKFTAPEACNVHNISAYISCVDAGNEARAGIYDAGANLLGQSGLVGYRFAAWYDFASDIDVLGAVNYLAIASDVDIHIFDDAGDVAQSGGDVIADHVLNDPLTIEGWAIYDTEMSIHADYTTADTGIADKSGMGVIGGMMGALTTGKLYSRCNPYALKI